jgi:hypothetical protein
VFESSFGGRDGQPESALVFHLFER